MGLIGEPSITLLIEEGSVAAIGDINVLRGVDLLLDAEAVRVLKQMPKWKPGEQRRARKCVFYNADVNLLYYYGNALYRISERERGIEVLTEGVEKKKKQKSRCLCKRWARLN